MDVEEPPPIHLQEIQSIADSELREKLILLYDQFERNRESVSRLQRSHIESEQEVFELQQQNENLGKKLHEAAQISADLKEQVKSLESEKAERTRRLFELESSHDASESQKAQLKRQCDKLLEDKKSLAEVLDSRNNDLENKKAEISALYEELRATVTKKCELQVKMGDLESREIALEYRENRFKEERELLTQEKEWLQKELRERDQVVHQLRKENNKNNLEYQTSMAATEDELRESKTALENANAQITRFTEQLESLNKKTKEAVDSAAMKEEGYEKELQVQIRLVQVYKQAAEESDAKVDELATALQNIEHLFNEAREQHFTTQEEIKQIREDFAKEMTEKDGTIVELRDELEKANELLRSKHRVMLSDEEIAALSPAAAAASKLIKSGMSLTQLYREHMKTLEELEQQKLDTKRVEAYFRELVQDIETKAPLLRQQQEGYSRSLTVIENLKRQLADVGKDQKSMDNERDTIMRQLTYTKAELERYQRDNADLSSQVRALVLCVERLRAGDAPPTSVVDVGRAPTAEDLLLFRNIDDLQSQNQRLLSALREAEARRDEMVKAAQEAEMSKIRAEVNGIMKEVEELRDQREKQNQLLESVRDERDTYKRLMHQAETRNDTAKEKETALPTIDSTESRKSLEKTQIEFEVYRKQKNETEKLLQEKLAKCETALAESRTTNTKLNSEVEYQTERFKVLSANVDTYKKQINSLHERNEKTSAMVAKQEQTIAHMTQDALSKTEESSRLKIENNLLQEQLHNAKTNESMAQQELQLLRKNQYTHQMVSMTLQELDARLKRREAEDTLKMKADLDAMTRERNNLQTNMKALTEQSQEYVRDCKAKIVSLEAKVADDERQAEHLRTQLQWTEEQLQAANSKTEELKNELEKLQSTYQDASAGRFQKEAQQLQTRLNYLEIRYTESNKKIEELTELLNSARNETQHYRRLADSLEGGLKEHKETSLSERSRFDDEFKRLNTEIEALTTENETLKKNLQVLQQGTNDILRQSGEQKTAFNLRVANLEKELAESKREMEEFKKRERELQLDRDRLADSTKEFREKFEQEFLTHGTTREALAETQEQLQQTVTQYNAIEGERNNLMLELESQKAMFDQRDGENESRLQTINERYEETKKQNENLLNEIEKMGNQVAMFEQLTGTKAAGDEEMEGSSLDVSTGEQSSTSAIMEVVKCLRRERQQVAEKNDYLDAEVRRLKSREQIMEREMASLKSELETASAEAAIAASATAEKSRLLTQLAALQSTQTVNKELREENDQLKNSISELQREVEDSTERHSIFAAQLDEARNGLEETKIQLEAFKQEASLWQKRYHELVEEKSKFEPEEISRLRKIVDEHLKKISDYEKLLDEMRSGHGKMSQQADELSAANADLTAQLESLRSEAARLQGVVDARDKTLTQARQLAVKYRDETKSLKSELDVSKANQEKLENEKKELEARCSALELRSRQAAVSSLDPTSEATTQISTLLSKLDETEKKLTEMKNSMANTGQKLVAVQAEKLQLEQQLAQLKEECAKIEQTSDERKFRLDSLTSMHSMCDGKLQKLRSELSALNEQYQSEKAAWEKQLQDAKTPSKPTPVHAVSAMPIPTGTSQQERPSPGGNHEQRTQSVRPSRQPVVSVRPLASQRVTAPIPPTAISPGPNIPDQSSSSLPSVPISISPSVISSSQSVTSGVPHAVVQPHVEVGHAAVTGSGDNFSDISSSVVITVDMPGTSEASAAAAPEPEAPIIVQKRRPPQDPSDRAPKRPRAASPEQVSTSEQRSSTFIHLPILPEEIVESGGLQPVVGSSLDENSGDEVIFVEEVERGFEPESSGQDQSFEDNRSVGVGLAPSDAGPSRSTARQQPHLGSNLNYPWDMGDDGIVPSTPTLISRRPEQDIGGAAHVPQGRFFWTPTVQEPFPSSQSFAIPPSDTTAQRSVPSTPRVITPTESLEREAASSSTILDIVNISGGQEPQPSGQAAEAESVENIGLGIQDEPEGTSEAMAAKAEEGESGGDEDSNEPTTSQAPPARSGVIRLRRRPDPESTGTESGASQSQPATSTVPGTGQQRARRAGMRGIQRGNRGRGSKKE